MARARVTFVLVVAGALAAPAPALLGVAVTTRILYVSAVDAKGRFVDDLTAAEIVVAEDDKPREVTAFEPATDPCHVAVIVDDGGEGLMQTPVIELLNAGAGRALFSIGMLNPQMIRLNDFTGDVDKLEQSAMRLVQRGRFQPDSHVLADTVSWTARDIQKRKLSRPVVVILTSGGESADREVARTILEDLRESGAALHVVYVVAVPQSSVLAEGPVQSGGSSTAANSTRGFSDALVAIAKTLAHQYKLTYVLPTGVRPGERLKVTTTRRDVKMMAPTRISSKVP